MTTLPDQQQVLEQGLVEELFLGCLLKEGADMGYAIEAEGRKETFMLDLRQLMASRDKIVAMVAELPDEFKNPTSMRRAGCDKHGRVWTDKLACMEKLILLGVAVGVASFPLPRPYWDAFSFGTPLFVVGG